MNWKRSMIGLGIAVPIIALLGYGLTVDPRYIASPLPGRQAPDFALPILDGPTATATAPATAIATAGTTATAGDSIRLSDLRGNVVLLNFWASWCIPCREEHPVLLEGAHKYLPKGVRFVGIAYNDKPGDSKDWLEELGHAYPSLIDEGARVAIDYGVTGVPETFILNRQGVVAFKKFGPLAPAELAQKLDSLLATP